MFCGRRSSPVPFLILQFILRYLYYFNKHIILFTALISNVQKAPLLTKDERCLPIQRQPSARDAGRRQPDPLARRPQFSSRLSPSRPNTHIHKHRDLPQVLESRGSVFIVGQSITEEKASGSAQWRRQPR